jgi:hypothetical protein
MDEHDLKLVTDVKQYGWHVLKILGDEEGPPYAFSVGLFHTFKHPEIVIFGLDLNVMHQIINVLAEDISSGKSFEPTLEYADILEGYRCTFEVVDPQWYSAFLGYAQWFYKSDAFPAVQCIWPDKQQRYPWQQNFESRLQGLQPLLVTEDRAQELQS